MNKLLRIWMIYRPFCATLWSVLYCTACVACRTTHVALLLTALLFMHCKPLKEVAIETRTVVRERLVSVPIPPDSTWLEALLRCDSAGQVKLAELTEYKSKGMESEFRFTNNKLQYKVSKKTDTLYIPVRDSFVEREVPLLVEVEKEVNKLTSWQQIQIWLGRGLFGITLLILLIWKLKF